jgi:putative transposase
MTILAYRFALDPTPRQASSFSACAGSVRVAYNWLLEQVRNNLSIREEERSRGVPEGQLPPSLSWSFQSLRNLWNSKKAQVAPWYTEISKEVFAGAAQRLANGLKNWKESKTGKRKGPRIKFPRMKSRHRSQKSFGFTTGGIRCERRRVRLPRLGWIRLHEDASRLVDLVEIGSARIRSASVKLHQGRWFVSFSVEQEILRPALTNPDGIVGIDLGIKTLATLSDGRKFENPRWMEAGLKKIRRRSRKASRRMRPNRKAGFSGSGRWARANTSLTRTHRKISNRRIDFIHKMTTEIAATYGIVVVEDLNVSGMMKNHRLARHIAGACWGEIRRQLEYKVEWRDGTLLVADRFFPSSKTCSECGAVRAKLLLSERTFVCSGCGFISDRDENAAENLRELGVKILAASGAGESKRTWSRCKTTPEVAVDDEASTRHRGNSGEAGTVPRQRGTAVEVGS